MSETENTKPSVDRAPPQTLVALSELADELQLHRGSIFKISKRLGITPTQRRDAARGNQKVHLVTEEQASAIRSDFFTNRRAGGDPRAQMPSDFSDEGMFYLIQLEPTFDPGRFKVGFTTDLDGRLRHHRCAAPFAVYKYNWPCRRTWERAATDCITAGLEQLHTEVFRGPSLECVADKAVQFFRLMPAVAASAAAGGDEETPNEGVG